MYQLKPAVGFPAWAALVGSVALLLGLPTVLVGVTAAPAEFTQVKLGSDQESTKVELPAGQQLMCAEEEQPFGVIWDCDVAVIASTSVSDYRDAEVAMRRLARALTVSIDPALPVPTKLFQDGSPADAGGAEGPEGSGGGQPYILENEDVTVVAVEYPDRIDSFAVVGSRAYRSYLWDVARGVPQPVLGGKEGNPQT